MMASSRIRDVCASNVIEERILFFYLQPQKEQRHPCRQFIEAATLL